MEEMEYAEDLQFETIKDDTYNPIYVEYLFKGEVFSGIIDESSYKGLLDGSSRLDRKMIKITPMNKYYGYYLCDNNKLKYLFSKEKPKNMDSIAIIGYSYIIDGNREFFIAAEEISEIEVITSSIIVSSKDIAKTILKEQLNNKRLNNV